MKNIIKKIIKLIIPSRYIRFLSIKKIEYHIKLDLFHAYLYDLNRYFNFSDTREGNQQIKLIGRIIKGYHVIEKGLTMPETRLGFGKEMIIQLCHDCGKFVEKYNQEEQQLIHALQVIEEYKNFHLIRKFKLDSLVLKSIENLSFRIENVLPTSQINISREDYFRYSESSSFGSFSNSRFSVRNFSDEDIKISQLMDALEIAKSAPSACNRQSWRTYTYTDKTVINEILKIQGGNRGFGHLANKLIIVTGEVGVFAGLSERNQVFIDGGIYAMNLLYSLHCQKIAGCILNCSISPAKDAILRKLCKIKDSEVFISMIACGIPPENFMLTLSKRYTVENTNTIINT